MQYTLMDLLKPEHIQVGVEAATAQEAIQKLTDSLVISGHVSAEFAQDVWQREQTFPTGLPTQPLAVAIPHADPDHVQRSAIAIGLLKSPVKFAQMGSDGSTLLDVRIIFLLAIKEREKQVEMIRQLMTLIQTPALLEGLAKAEDAQETEHLIRATL
jgi:PTS system galactitol-specific IIA component